MGERLEACAGRLDALLAGHGINVAGGTSLFRFIRQADAQRIFDVLGRQGIFARRFVGRPDELRIGLPSEDQWERLETALDKLSR